ncbi:MAG: nuclease-related domain-containing protein [Minisyncoccota bacterium]
MKIIPYQKSYSSRQLRKIAKYVGLIFIILLLSTFAWLVSFNEQLDVIYRILVLAFAYLGIWIFYKYSFDHIDPFVNNLFGKEGESIIELALKNSFDDSYTYIKNYKIPNTKIGDIDGLLISPNEIIIIEVKFYSGVFEIINGIFYKFHKKPYPDFFPHNPIKQVERQKDCLTSFLKEKGLEVHIRDVVVLAHGRVKNIQGPTGVYVLNKDNLVDFIRKETSAIHNSTAQSTKPVLECLIDKSLIG